MANKKSSLDIVIAELSQAIGVMDQYAATPDSSMQLLEELGYKVPDVVSVFDDILVILPGHITTLDRVIAMIDAGDYDNPDFLIDVLSLTTSTIALIEAISELPTQLDAALSAHTDFLNNSGIKDDLPIRLIDFLLLKHLAINRPALFSFLQLIGIARVTFVSEDTYNPDFHLYEMKWDGIITLFDDPAQHFEEVYGWGTENYDPAELLGNLETLFWTLGVTTANTDPDELSSIVHAGTTALHDEISIKVPFMADFIEFGSGPEDFGGFEFGMTIHPTQDAGNDANGGIGLSPYLYGQVNQTVDLSENWQLDLSANVELEGVLSLHFTPLNGANIETTGIAGVDARLEAEVNRSNPDKIVLVNTGGFEISIGDISVGTQALLEQGEPVIITELSLERCAVALGAGDADGFLQKILPADGINSNFDLTIGWASDSGIYFRGSAALELTIPVHEKVGPIMIETVYLSVDIGNELTTTIAASFGAKLGPISASVDRIGVIIPVQFRANKDGNLGPVNIDGVRFKFPRGAGLSLDAGPIVGGGYLECDSINKRYAGILELAFGDIGLVAIGLITTRMPDGSDGFSLLVLICVTFSPAFQLSFGFTLAGVGGLVGINRDMETDVLRDGLRNRTLDSILFPEDPILNAQKIISDLRSVFPPDNGRFVVGPMIKIGWGTPTIITADIGIFISLPMPIKIVLLGQIGACLPDKDHAIIELHLDVLGVLDFEREELSIDASIYDSRIITFTLTGDMMLRISWGASPVFAMSLGGFHPKFSPPPEFPILRRLMLSLSSDKDLQLYCQVYMALTANSLQFGAKLYLYAAAGGASVEGNMTFDALIYFSPFAFIISMGGSLTAKFEGNTLMSVSIYLELAGPTPWHAKGSASFKILFWEISVAFDVTWGPSDRQIPPAVNPLPPLMEALNRTASWGSALPPTSRMVEALRLEDEDADTDRVVMHCAGTLEVRENTLPFNVRLQKLGNSPVKDYHTFVITDVYSRAGAGRSKLDFEYVEEFFARGQFEDLPENKRLSLPSFELMPAGIRGAFQSVKYGGNNNVKPYELKYESILINEDKTAETAPGTGSVQWSVARRLVKGNASFRSQLRNTGHKKYDQPGNAQKLTMVKEGYVVVNISDMTPVQLEAPIHANDGTMTRMQADQAIEAYITLNPDEAGNIQVVPAFEVAA